jgi:hypothetical protein
VIDRGEAPLIGADRLKVRLRFDHLPPSVRATATVGAARREQVWGRENFFCGLLRVSE